MKTSTFNAAAHRVLTPLGFVARRGRREWRREIGGYLDVVDIQLSPLFDELTINLHIRDLITRRVIESLAPGLRRGSYYVVDDRLGPLMGRGRSWWARDDRDGPAEVAEGLRTCAMPFLDRMHSPIELSQHLARYGQSRWGFPLPRMELAINVARLGEISRALELLSDPPSGLEPAEAAGIPVVREWISQGCPPLSKASR